MNVGYMVMNITEGENTTPFLKKVPYFQKKIFGKISGKLTIFVKWIFHYQSEEGRQILMSHLSICYQGTLNFLSYQ